MSPDDHLDHLYREGIRLRDQGWAAYVANLNRMSQMLGSARQFVADYGHLVPAPEQPPLSAGAPSGMSEARSAPPPLPESAVPYTGDIPPPSYAEEEMAAARFEQRLEGRRASYGGPGLEGVMGGRR